MGEMLLNDNSPEGQRLLAFVRSEFRESMYRELETAKDAGLAWFACMKATERDPGSALAQGFTMLDEAWNAAKSNADDEA